MWHWDTKFGPGNSIHLSPIQSTRQAPPATLSATSKFSKLVARVDLYYPVLDTGNADDTVVELHGEHDELSDLLEDTSRRNCC